MSVADQSALKPTTAITVSVWVKPTGTQESAYTGIVSKFNGGNYYGYTLKDSGSGALQFWVKVNGENKIVNNSPFPANDVWTFVTGVYDGTNVILYRNGVSVGSTPASGDINQDTTSLRIGDLYGDGSFTFNGSIDDVRIYSKALTASEVYALYQAGRPRTQGGGFSKMLFPPIDQSVVGWWKLNDAAGQTVVKDWSASGNTGTSLNNITTATGYTGVANTAMSFNGVVGGDYIAVADNASMKNANFTVSAWIYPLTGADYDFEGILSFMANNNDTYCIYVSQATGYEFRIMGVSTNYNVTFASTVNAWHHIVLTYNGSVATGYFDGVSKNTYDRVGITYDSSGFVIGRAYSSLAGYYFKGSIDDVRVYNRALSANEVHALYMKGRP